MVKTALANAIVTGIVTGSVVALGAIGLALVYSIAEVPNFAHGELLTLGAYIAFFVNEPSTVPVFELLATGTRAVSVWGFVFLFALAAGSMLAVVYQLGGRPALAGEWWPVSVPAPVGVAGHVLVAALLGLVVVVGFPSIWGGMLLAVLVMAAVAPLFEQVVFGKFRARGADLATMLIVALGLSFVLRFGTQAFYGGGIRAYTIPRIARVAGTDVPIAAAQLFNFYLTGAGVTIEMINSAVPTAERATLLVVNYSWPAVLALLVASLVVALVAYRWRRGGEERFTSGQTVGPRLTGIIAGVLTFVVLAAVLPTATSVPGRSIYATQVKLSLIRGATIAIAVAMMGVLHLLLQETRFGKAMRAASDNLDLAKVTGINTDRVMTVTWVIAGSYAAIGGVMLGVLFPSINPSLGFFLLLPMFAGVIVGGVGSVYGAILGSFLVGLSMDVGIFLFDISGVHRISIAFVVLLIVLLVKPEGIVGAGGS